jgi:hypothetical protein
MARATHCSKKRESAPIRNTRDLFGTISFMRVLVIHCRWQLALYLHCHVGLMLEVRIEGVIAKPLAPSG